MELDFVNKIVGTVNVDLLLPTFTLFEGYWSRKTRYSRR